MSGRHARVLLAAVVLGIGATALAGLHDPGQPVVFGDIGDGLTGFSGTVGDVHNSANRVEFVGCQTLNTATTRITFCWAQDAGNHYAYCQSSSPAVAATADSIDSDSFVQVNYDSNGTCVQVSVDHSSKYARIQ